MELVKNIFFNTDKLIENSKIKISYTGKFFEENSDKVFIHFGYGLNWDNISEIEMKKTDLGFQAEINLISSNFHIITNDLLLAAMFGGGILGVGVGIVLKNSACMDGAEILAMKVSKKYPFSVGEIIMVINVFVFLTAGFLYGWEQAMYSTLTYIVAYRAIDMIVQGLSEEKSIRIISDKGFEIGQGIIEKFDKTVTYIEAQGGYSKTAKKMIYCIVPRIELYKLKELITSIDKDAFLSIENVHEVYGKRYKK